MESQSKFDPAHIVESVTQFYLSVSFLKTSFCTRPDLVSHIKVVYGRFIASVWFLTCHVETIKTAITAWLHTSRLHGPPHKYYKNLPKQ